MLSFFCHLYSDDEKTDMESRVRWTISVVETAAQRGFSQSYLEYCCVFGLYDL